MATAESRENPLELAVAAVHAWGCYVELLGQHFLARDPPVGQPMLKVCHVQIINVQTNGSLVRFCHHSIHLCWVSNVM